MIKKPSRSGGLCWVLFVGGRFLVFSPLIFSVFGHLIEVGEVYMENIFLYFAYVNLVFN